MNPNQPNLSVNDPAAARAASGRANGRSWLNWPLSWFAGAMALGYGASVVVHLFLLLGCSLMIVAGSRAHEGAIIAGMSGVGTSTGPEGGFEDVFDTTVDVPKATEAILAVAPAIVAPGEGTQTVQPMLSANALAKTGGNGSGEGSGSGEGTGEGTGHKFTMPSGGNVVTEGNFTAWTVPADPKPNEDYSIIVQIKLPKRVKVYRSDDLSGTVVGTDRYRQDLPGLQPKFLQVKKNSVQVEIPVPRAAELVQDTIRIKSKMLKEEQELQIVF